MKKTILLAAFALLVFSCDKSGVCLPTGSGEAGFNIDPRTDDLWDDVNASAAGFDVTNYFDFILSASHLGMDQKYIGVALKRFSDAQVKEGADLGKVPRYIGGDLSDENNIEFALELAAPALIEYYDGWNEENRALFDDFVDKALYASWNHDNVAVSYTNIYLMRVWNMIAFGENLDSTRTWGDSKRLSTAAIAGKGYAMLDSLVAFTKKWGIHEHNSPTYTGVQAECAGYLAKYTKNPDARAKAVMLKDYLSAMVFANYFAPGKVLTGAMSRCYYRGSSGGKIDQLAGGLIYGYGMYWYNVLAAWEPSVRDREVNSTYPRLVAYTFGPEMGEDGAYAMNAMNYIDRKFSISSAGHHYTGNGTEKTVSVVVVGLGNSGAVNFRVRRGVKGNTVLALRNPEGKIVWSWHVWMMQSDLLEPTHYTRSADKKLANCNIGATSAEEGSVDSYGLYYQWGRKDPFPSANAVGGTTGKEATSFVTGTKAYTVNPVFGIKGFSTTRNSNTASVGDVAYSIANPMTNIHYYNNGGTMAATGTWLYGTSQTDAATLWSTSNTVKSNYDPCPQGYQVPINNAYAWYSYWTAAGNCTFESDNSLSGVVYRQAEDNRSYYPATGYRASGQLVNCGYTGMYWAANSKLDGTNWVAYGLKIEGRSTNSNGTKILTQYALPVRCMKYNK